MVALSNTLGTHVAVFLFFIILANLRRSNGQTSTTTTATTTGTTPTTGTSTNCVKGTCNTENMPKLGETDTLEIKLYYHGMNDEATADIQDVICDVTTACGIQVTSYPMMGAFAETINNELFCGAYGCDRDRLRACQQLLNPEEFKICDSVPIVNEEDLDACLTNADADDVLLSNAQERRDLGIQYCEVPMIAFNDYYDPCVDVTSSETLLTYVCNMFDNTLACCSS